MGWLDANEYLLMEMVGRDRIDDITQTAHRVRTAGDRHDASDVTPYEMRKRARRFVERLMCFLLSQPGIPAPPHPALSPSGGWGQESRAATRSRIAWVADRVPHGQPTETGMHLVAWLPNGGGDGSTGNYGPPSAPGGERREWR